MTECINLQERFGRKYRIGWEAEGKTRNEWAREDWPWLMEIRCRYGTVAPFGGEILQASTDRRPIGRKLRALPCVLHARGDLEVVVRFHVDAIEQVLAVLKPYRRRQVSDAEKARLTAMGERFRFGGSDGVQSDFRPLESTNATRNDAEATGALPTLPDGTEGADDAIL